MLLGRISPQKVRRGRSKFTLEFTEGDDWQGAGAGI